MKLKIKMPSKQFDVEIEPSASVADLRKVVASAVEKKEEQIVLIFGGKILKDTDTVESHSIKDGQAVHLVVKQPRQEDPKPAAETSSAPVPGPASTTTTTTPSSTTRASPTAASTNPFAALAGGMAGSGGMGNMQQQAQQMMQNPQAMQEMMNSPMMQAIMENPDVMQSIIQSNPQMRQLMETNPEIGHILNNPEHMRQAMEMMRNPSMMQEMMRNQDRALSNLESLPGGFNALQRFYNEVQEPMQNAMGRPNPFATPTNENNTNTENTQAGTQNTEALPNPWAAPAATNNAPGQTGGAGGLPGMGGLGAAAGVDPGMMRAMMGMMQNNPQLMRQALQAAPGFQGANLTDEQIAQVAQTMGDPATMEAMSNPRVLEAFQQIQRAHEVIRQEAPGLLNMMGGGPGMGSMPGAPGAQPGTGATGATPPAGGNDFMANMLRTMGGMGGGAGAGVPPVANPEEHYASQLEQLEMMGFTNRAANIEELQRTQGNVEAAVDRLLARPR